MKCLTALLSFAMLITLAGCATNALRVQQASDVAQKGQVVAIASRHFLAEVERARYAANVDIIAADPACWQRDAGWRRPPLISGVTDPRNPPRGWLCVSPGRGVMLGPIRRELAPTIELIDSLAAYSAAITEILGETSADPSQDLEHALATARSAEGLLRTLQGGTHVTLVPATDDDRLTAVTGFAGFLTQLSNEADHVARLRRLRDSGSGGTALVNALIDHLANWEQSRAETEALGVDLAERLLEAATREGAPLSGGERRDFARGYFDRLLAQAASGQLHDALDAALQGLKQAETDYQQLISEHPQLTRRQRQQRAEIIRQRLARTLQLATSLLGAFAGA